MKALAFNSALALAGLQHGVAQAERNHQFVSSKDQCVVFTDGRACYMNSKRLPPMRVGARKILADGVQAIVMEDIRAEVWYEQLVATVARVKAFFGYSKDKQDELIQFTKVHQVCIQSRRLRVLKRKKSAKHGILTQQQKILQQNAESMRKRMAPSRQILADRKLPQCMNCNTAGATEPHIE
jgi:hypothetical protein